MDKLINISGRRNVGDCVGDINANFEYLDNKTGGSGGVTVDTELSTESTNPVQNKVVTKAINGVTNAVNDKVSNSSEGMTELFDNLIESETTPGNEDYLIIKSLKQYTLRPFTALWNWIKSNLAKVATSGSYNDLANKPDIPTVDSSFSESGTNAVAGNVILSALNSKANKAELQALSNQVSNKADKSELGTAAAKDVPTSGNAADTQVVLGNDTRLNKSWYVGSDNANTAGWYKFFTVTSIASFSDINATFLITNEYGAENVGILYMHVRRDTQSTSPAPGSLSWLFRKGWTSDSVMAVVNGLSVDLYIYQRTSQYSGIRFNLLNCSCRGSYKSAKYTAVSSTAPTTGLTASATSADNSTVSNATRWNGLTDDTMTANTTDSRLMVLNGNKVQHRQIDTLPFLSSGDLAQSVLYTSTTTTTSATITGLFDYSLIWLQVVGSKTTHTHVVPLRYLKTKGELIFKDNDTPFNLLYVSDTQIRWFEYQGAGAETYSAVTIVKIL